MTRILRSWAAVTLLAACASSPDSKPPSTPAADRPTARATTPRVIEWQAFTPAVLARAAAERRIIVLSIGTTWCHWCHVMDEKTWADPAVAALVADRFLPIRADADAAPDLKARYEPWGWPATILLTPDAEPLGELKGYVAKEKLLPYFQKLAADLSNGTLQRREVPRKAEPPVALQAAMALAEAQLDGVYDDEVEGWGGPKKYPLLAPMHVGLYRGERFGDAAARAQVLATAEKLLALCDPVWGGMYQYSTHNRWDHPHTEKLAEIQGSALLIFADAWRLTGDARYRKAGDDTVRYLNEFLSDEGGGFFANQDADGGRGHGADSISGRTYYALDDAARRAAGVPYIDRHIFAAHNAYVLRGLAAWVAITGDAGVRARMVRGEQALATLWTAAGFVHAAGQRGIFLEDQVAAAEAYEAMYAATLDDDYRRRWLNLVPVLTSMIDDERGGFRNAQVDEHAVGIFRTSHVPLGLSARAAQVLLRSAELLPEETAEPQRARAKEVLARLSTKRRLERQGRGVGETLLALYDAAYEPVHVSLVGPRDERGQALLSAAHRARVPGALFEHVGPEGRFGVWDEPAVFICGRAFCSRPVTAVGDVARVAGQFSRVERKVEAEPTPP